MNVYVTQPFSHESMAFYECQCFLMFHRNSHRESFQKRKYRSSALKIPACKFTYDKRMARNLSIVQKVYESGVRLSEMRNPDRCIN